MFYLKFYFIVVFSVKGLSALPVLLTRGYTRSLHTETRVSLVADGSAEDVSSNTTSNGNGTEVATATTNGVVYEEPVAESSWICRFSSGNRGPCYERADAVVPAGRFCLPGSCCSKTVVKEDNMGMWCATEPIFCNGLVYYKEFSFDQCSCYKARAQCHRAATCVDQLVPLRGVFCKCKPGYLGDGKTCRRDPCESSNPCGTHGKCVGDPEGGYSCACNEGYTETEVSGRHLCRKKNACEIIPEACGPPEAVKECKPNGDDFACACNSGWKAAAGLNQKCEPISHKSPCAGDPCGSEEAVLECIEGEGDSYTCSCSSGYTVEEVNGKEVCRSMRGDPCDTNPCGKENLVAACTPTDHGYTCTCKKGATLKGTKDAPYCADDLSAFFAIVAVIAFFVVLIGAYYFYEWRHKRSMQQAEDYDAYNVDYSYFSGSPDFI